MRKPEFRKFGLPPTSGSSGVPVKQFSKEEKRDIRNIARSEINQVLLEEQKSNIGIISIFVAVLSLVFGSVQISIFSELIFRERLLTLAILAVILWSFVFLINYSLRIGPDKGKFIEFKNLWLFILGFIFIGIVMILHQYREIKLEYKEYIYQTVEEIRTVTTTKP